jgi:hypothetical protein
VKYQGRNSWQPSAIPWGQALRAQTESDIIDALLFAGQFESALSDCECQSSKSAELVTDLLAAKMSGGRLDESEIQRQMSSLENSTLPVRLRISPAEGFSYYALHPTDFADALSNERQRFAAIGIRSIGTVLSTVAQAALNLRGICTGRITVRPQGHPYNRKLEFNDAQGPWVEEQQEKASRSLIVDEGRD